MSFAGGIWTPEDDGVAGRVAAITSTDSAFMRSATAAGERGANRRGMINSTMGIGAGVGAGIAAAVPIASQESKQIGDRNLVAMQNMQADKGITVDHERIAASDRQSAASNMVELNRSYTSGIANTLQNDKIPSDVRGKVQSDFAALYTADIAKIKALYPSVTW